MEMIRLGSGRRAAFGAGVLIVLGIAILLIWALFNFGNLGNQTHYHTLMGDVSGLRPGANVEIAGYQVGVVQAIEPVAEKSPLLFAVELRVGADWVLPDDTKAVLSRPNPVAAPIVLLKLGTSGTPLEHDGEIATDRESVLPDQLAQLMVTVSTLIDEDIRPLTTALRGTVETLNVHVSDNLPPLMYDARDTLDRVNASVRDLQLSVATLTARASRALSDENVAAINNTLASLDRAAEQLNRLLAESETLVTNADTLVNDLGETVEGVDSVVRETGPAAAALAGDAQFVVQSATPRLNAILLNLERATEDMAGLAAELRRNPALVIGIEPSETGPGQ
jgi:phospholipid/cholesterol/gamma-HCH transport system substrate-binding protein